MTLYSLPPFIASILNCFLMFLVLIARTNNKKNGTTIAYVLWNLSMAVWNMGFAILYIVTDVAVAYQYNHFLILGTLFIFPTTFNFILAFTNLRTKFNNYLLYASYALSVLFLIFHFKMHFLSVELRHYPWGYYPLALGGDIIYSIAFFAYSTYAQVLLYRLMRRSTGQKRNQYRFIFWGTVIGYAGATTNFLPPFGIDCYPIGNITTILYSAAVAYALVTVKTVNLNYLLRMILTQAGAFLTMLLLSIAVTFPILRFFPGMSFSARAIAGMFTTLILAKLLYSRIAAALDLHLFRRKATFAQDIHNETNKIRSILTNRQLAEELAKAIVRAFMIEKCRVKIVEKEGSVAVAGFTGRDGALSLDVSRVENRDDRDVFLPFLRWSTDILVRDEVEKRIELGKAVDEEELRLYRAMEENGFSLIVAVGKSSAIRGYILLGNKFSGDIFDSAEIYALLLLKNSAEVSLLNIENVDIIKAQEKRVEEEVQKANRLESLGVLAGGIAHDFNNLLTIITGNMSLARKSLPAKGEIREIIAEAEQAAKRARGLTQQLLTFAKGGTPMKKTLSIAELLHDWVIFTLRGSHIRCEFDIPDDLWIVEADEGQFNQVINNIVINAKEAMPQGGIIEVKAANLLFAGSDNDLRRPGRCIRISITDHGCGIPENLRGRIFDPYFTTKEKGSGLGLASVYSIIKQHSGTITVESETGAGTTFHIYLPAVFRQTAPPSRIEVRPVRPGRGKILIMDDDEMILQLLGRTITSFGYSVAACRDGKEAVEEVAEAKKAGQPFDIVIMDLTVPGGMGGKAAVLNIKEVCPEIRVVASSGYSNDAVMADPKKHHFDDILPKPYDIEEMSIMLDRMMSGG